VSFHWPYALLALPLTLAALLALFAGSQRARQRLLAQFATARLLPGLLASFSPALRRLKHFLLTAGVLLAVLALARPQWGFDWQEQKARGVDVVFAVDVSRSMLAEDVQPSRLERAKLAILDLVEKMPGNRVGLVAFAGQAFLQCPLTLDYDAFRQTLDAMDPSVILRGGTDISAALAESETALEGSGNDRIIVLITDGEDLAGEGIAAAKSAAVNKTVIYTVGVGTPEGEIIPIRDKAGRVDFVRDDNGQIVKSKLDAATLTAIAQASNGFYVPLGPTGEGLTQVYEGGIKKTPEQEIAAQMQRTPIERFQWPLGAALFLLALEPLLGTRRPSWWRRPAVAIPAMAPAAKPAVARAGVPPVLAALVLLALALPLAPHLHAAAAGATGQDEAPTAALNSQPPVAAPAQSPATPASAANPPAPGGPRTATTPRAAQNLYQNGDYKSAADAYGQAANAAPQDWRFRYNQGTSLYRSGDYAGAADTFQQALGSSDLSLQQRAYYNLGNSLYRVGQAQMKEDPKKTVATWESALNDYQNALDLNAGDTDARYNYDLLKKQLEDLKKKLEEQQKQQQQQQQQNQQDQQQQNQQQQNQQNQNQDQKQDQQNQQNQQNQSGQDQKQNQQNQQNQQQQNQSGQGQKQDQQNQNQQNQQNQSGQGQNQQPDQKDGQGQKPDQSKPGQNQNQQQNQGAGQDQQKQQQQQQQNANQANQGQGQRQDQAKPQANPAAGTRAGQPAPPQPKPGQGTEPAGQKPGQRQGQAGAAGTAGDKQGDGEQGVVLVPGQMTREEARQVLDSLKTGERKLPASSYDPQKSNAQPDQQKPYKDW